MSNINKTKLDKLRETVKNAQEENREKNTTYKTTGNFVYTPHKICTNLLITGDRCYFGSANAQSHRCTFNEKISKADIDKLNSDAGCPYGDNCAIKIVDNYETDVSTCPHKHPFDHCIKMMIYHIWLLSFNVTDKNMPQQRRHILTGLGKFYVDYFNTIRETTDLKSADPTEVMAQPLNWAEWDLDLKPSNWYSLIWEDWLYIMDWNSGNTEFNFVSDHKNKHQKKTPTKKYDGVRERETTIMKKSDKLNSVLGVKKEVKKEFKKEVKKEFNGKKTNRMSTEEEIIEEVKKNPNFVAATVSSQDSAIFEKGGDFAEVVKQMPSKTIDPVLIVETTCQKIEELIKMLNRENVNISDFDTQIAECDKKIQECELKKKKIVEEEPKKNVDLENKLEMIKKKINESITAQK